MEKKKSSVFYTDGGSRPNNGYGGAGIHGYEFDNTVAKKGSGLKDWNITPSGYLQTRKSLKEVNDKEYNKMKYNFWLIYPELAEDPKIENLNVINYFDMSKSLGTPITNNIAELEGLKMLLEFLKDKDYERTIIYVDSRYVLDGVTEWIHNWAKNNWVKSDKKEISNLSLWKDIYALINELNQLDTNIVFNWVKGHIGNPGNEKADHNATLGVIASRMGRETFENISSTPDGYWNLKSFVNRLTPLKYWYFNTYSKTPVLSKTNKIIYHFGDHGKEDDFIGKPLSDTCYSIAFLNEPLKNLETIRNAQTQFDYDGNNALIVAKHSVLNGGYNNLLMKTYGYKYLYKEGKKKDLYNPNKVQLTKELNPPKTAFNLIEIMSNLQTKLEHFLDNDTDKLCITELTDKIFELNQKNKLVLSKDIKSTTKALDLKTKYEINNKTDTRIVTYTLGHDILDRNALAGLVDDDPKIYSITWKESSKGFRYATVVVLKNGDAAIYAGYYSNIVLIN